jgi:hemoglobin
MAAKSTVLVVGSLALALLAGSVKAEDKSLYQRLGGYDAIAAVSDEFIARLANDEQEKRFFIGLSTDSKIRIRQLLVDLVCKSTGGPCVYTGRDMKTAHAGAGITKADWDRSLKIFGDVPNKFKVPEKEQQELAALLLLLERASSTNNGEMLPAQPPSAGPRTNPAPNAAPSNPKRAARRSAGVTSATYA